MIVKIEADVIPHYQTEYAAAVDLHSAENVTIRAGQHALVKTGVRVDMPHFICAEIMSRSGLALKNKIQAHHGLIDPDYKKEIGVVLFNLGTEDFVVREGDRIAQMKFSRFERVEFVAEPIVDNERGGFGSTNV
jgi:dUTP pyrophosphatase